MHALGAGLVDGLVIWFKGTSEEGSSNANISTGLGFGGVEKGSFFLRPLS